MKKLTLLLLAFMLVAFSCEKEETESPRDITKIPTTCEGIIEFLNYQKLWYFSLDEKGNNDHYNFQLNPHSNKNQYTHWADDSTGYNVPIESAIYTVEEAYGDKYISFDGSAFEGSSLYMESSVWINIPNGELRYANAYKITSIEEFDIDGDPNTWNTCWRINCKYWNGEKDVSCYFRSGWYIDHYKGDNQ